MTDYTSYVNIKQGTFSEYKCSTGNTLPLVAAPFGMNAYALQTRGSVRGWYYHSGSRQIEGIRLTHQPSPWIGEYAQLTFMPQTKGVIIYEDHRTSGFKELAMNPAFMEIYFKRYRATIKVTPTDRCAVITSKWEVEEMPRFAIFPGNAQTSVKLDPIDGELTGYVSSRAGGAPENFKMYFYFKFNQPINVSETYITCDGNKENGIEGCGVGLGINIAFDMPMGAELQAVLGTSYISCEFAKENVIREIGEKSYEDVKAETKSKWNALLSKIRIKDTEEKKKTFYSCFYRCFLFPRMFYEYDKENKPVHYNTNDGTIAEGVMYTDNGFWDTYRSLFPLFSLLIPERMKEVLEGFLNYYKEHGWLPKWISPGERGMMPGTLIDAVLADAIVKDILPEEQRKLALEGMLKNAETISSTPLRGRIGVKEYCELGYVPCDKYGESANNSLDAYYCDYCISKAAEKMNLPDIQKKFEERSKNYKLLFDESVGFIHGRKADGSFKEDFSAIRWGAEFCEGSAWQNGFSVFHDIDGLASLYRGKEEFAAKLDELFATPPVYEIGTYYTEIHEMTEMALADWGQCAISNQPSFHIPYLYSAVGYPEKTAYWVRRIVEEGFSADVFPGDEDNGSMGAWYVFATLGFYPVCPGSLEYVTGVSNAAQIEVELWNSKTLQIENELCDTYDFDGMTVKVNGTPVKDQKLTHEQLLNGGNITFSK